MHMSECCDLGQQGDVDDFGVALEAAGYRGDRLSIWGVQVPASCT